MSNQTESEVSKKVQSRLIQWEKWGYVIFHDRYNAGKIPIGYRWVQLCTAGHPDRMAFLRVKDVCWIYLIEVKDDEGKQSPKQIEFENKFDGLSNVIYEIVRDPKQIDRTMELITNRTELLLQHADDHMNGVHRVVEETF